MKLSNRRLDNSKARNSRSENRVREAVHAQTDDADRQLSSKVGLGSGCEGSAFLVTYMDPLDGLQTSQRVGKAVRGIPDHA